MKLLYKTDYKGSRWGLTFSNDQQFLLYTRGTQAIGVELNHLTRTFSLGTRWGNGAGAVFLHPTQALIGITGGGYSKSVGHQHWMYVPIYDLDTQKLKQEIELFGDGVSHALFINDDLLVWAGGDVGGGIYSLTGGPQRELPVGGEAVHSLATHPDMRTLMMSTSCQGDITVHIFDVYNHTTSRNEELSREISEMLDDFAFTIPHDRIKDALFSPDGKYIIVTHRHILVYSYPERQLLRSINQQGEAVDALWSDFSIPPNKLWTNPVFTYDSAQMLCGSPDGLIYCWDLQSGELLSKRPVHNGQIFRLALSPDNKLLASSSADGTLKLWQLEE